jgi:hypothetical protein
MLREHELETATGAAIVQHARLACAMPLLSTVLRTGEAVVVVRTGDQVHVAGLERPPADHPFRGTNALVPGPDGVEVSPASESIDRWTHAMLVAWRPCVAYLLIVVAVAVPVLIGAARSGRF